MEKFPHTDAFTKGLSQPEIRALVNAGYPSLDQVAGASEKELLQLHGVGPKSIPTIRQTLADAKLVPLRP